MASSQPQPARSLRARLGPYRGRLGLIAAIAAAVVALDAITKAIAASALAGQGRVEILGGLVQFDLYRNFAGPNNIFPGHTILISAFGIAAVLVLVAVAYRVSSTLAAVAIGLLLGGAIGNLLDRLLRAPGPLRGGVVDWLRFTDNTKSMNLADLAIDAAIVVMIVAAGLSWWNDRSRQGEPSGETAP